MFTYHLNLTSSIFLIFIIMFVLWRIVRVHQAATEKQNIIKIVIIFLLSSVITGKITQHIYDIPFQIPILPIGVWLIYLAIDKQKNWPSYRWYAWLGFTLSVLLTISNIIAYPIQKALYPPNEITNFINELDSTTIFTTHLSGADHVILTTNALDIIQNATYEPNDSWGYAEFYYRYDNPKAKERFPYLLQNTKSKFGSGYHPYIFIEQDGRGLLIIDKNVSNYFHLDESILNEVK